MADPNHLLIVFPTSDAADQFEAMVPAGTAVRRGLPLDVVEALQVEVQAEAATAVILPQAVVVTDRLGARSFLLVAGLAAIGAAVAAVVGAFVPWGGLSYGPRLLILLAVLEAAAFTIALVAGPALGARSPDEASPAAQGEVVRVESDEPAIRRLLEDSKASSIDVVDSQGDFVERLYEKQVPTSSPSAEAGASVARVRSAGRRQV